jgi:3-oxoacyl-[acyl-carrier protein] reductase
MSLFNLESLNALVTGATGGLGEGIAKVLAQQGAFVALSGTNKNKLEHLKKKLVLENSEIKEPLIFPCSFEDSSEIKELIPKIEKEMGKIDILVNNAGIVLDSLLLRMKDEEWERVLRVNLTSIFKLSRAVLPFMLKRRFGRIIQVTSVIGHTGNAGQSNYAASKGGITSFSKSLSLEVATRSITVNCVAPGFIETPMTDNLSEIQKAKILEKIPVARLGSAFDVASTIAFLSSREASYITGQTIHVNGGMLMV